jgi:hypothetical protein
VHPVAYLLSEYTISVLTDGRTDMLKIIDLNRNEELSAASMGKVAGGADKTKDEESIRNDDTVISSDVTMAGLWNRMFGSIAPV